MRKKRRPTGNSSGALSVFLAILVGLLLFAVIYFAFQRYDSKYRIPSGRYVSYIDISPRVDDALSLFLAEVLPEDATHETVYISDIKVETELYIMPDGEYSITVDKDSYENACAAAYEECERELYEVLAYHLEKAGVDPETITDEYAEGLLNDTIGMDGGEYIKNILPDAVPSFDELNEKYAKSGSITPELNKGLIIDGEGTGIHRDGDRLTFKDAVYEKTD